MILVDIGVCFEVWDGGKLKFYLVEIMGKVLLVVDS